MDPRLRKQYLDGMIMTPIGYRRDTTVDEQDQPKFQESTSEMFINSTQDVTPSKTQDQDYLDVLLGTGKPPTSLEMVSSFSHREIPTSSKSSTESFNQSGRLIGSSRDRIGDTFISI